MDDIRKALYKMSAKGARKSIKELASAYEDITLSCEAFPDEGTNLIIEILSTKELFDKPGIDIFLLKTSTDMYRFSVEQKEKLLKAIRENYHQYSNLDMCWQLCDLIARSYSESVAMQTFREIFNSATNQGKKGVALGLDILVRQSKGDEKLIQEVKKILNLA